MPLPRPPVDEPPRVAALEDLAPRFRDALLAILEDMAGRGHQVRVFETLRTHARQAYLYGFGREYDDGRGPVTKAPTAEHGWHYYALAADLVQDDATPWVAPQAFWQDLGKAAETNGCAWGGRWKALDLPHVQWGRCRPSPSPHARSLYAAGGHEAVWRAVGAA